MRHVKKFLLGTLMVLFVWARLSLHRGKFQMQSLKRCFMNGALRDECELTMAEEQRKRVLSSPTIYIAVMALTCLRVSHLSVYSHLGTQKVAMHAGRYSF